jgi:peptide/nickel transport system permease protein
LATGLITKRPWYSLPRIRRGLAEARRYPIISIVILLLVLFIPAAFANWIAPHHPTDDGDLTRRLLPPAWVAKETAVKTVVERVTAGKHETTISLADAQKETRLGRGQLATPDADGLDRPVAVGDQFHVVTKPGGLSTYLLGTDKLGRDILSRIIHGSRISVVVAGIAIFIGGTIGTFMGIAAGYFGGWVDAVVMRLVDIAFSIPIILIAMVLVVSLGASFRTIILVLILFLWATYARQARGETLTVRVQDYIARARVSGASNLRIMLRHVFPNIFNSLVVIATLQVGFVIILESTLSFLGAGLPKPTPAWGLMVADGRELIISAWWVSLFPGLAIMLVVICMNLLGDWLRDRLDPKQRQV